MQRNRRLRRWVQRARPWRLRRRLQWRRWHRLRRRMQRGSVHQLLLRVRRWTDEQGWGIRSWSMWFVQAGQGLQRNMGLLWFLQRHCFLWSMWRMCWLVDLTAFYKLKNIHVYIFHHPPSKCWEPQICHRFDGNISLKSYHNVKEDVIEDTFLRGFPKQMCLKSNIDERIQTQVMYSFININYVFEHNFFLCVSNDILFHIMVQFKWNLVIKFLANLGLPTL